MIYFTAWVVIKTFEKNMRFPLLLDTYGVMLSERKREIIDYYYNEDYSLSEISEITGISRQGVRDSIKKSEEEIYSLEEKLKFVQKNDAVTKLCKSIIAELHDIASSDDVSDEGKIKIRKTTDRLSMFLSAFSATMDATDQSEE